MKIGVQDISECHLGICPVLIIQYNTNALRYTDNLITVCLFNYKTNVNSLKISTV